MEGLVELLDAARTSTPGEDLAGERAAVAGFLAARQRAVPTAPPRRSRAVRTIAMKVALGFAVLAFGGTALAARTGSLPPAAQERAHDIFSQAGVPAPDRSRQPSAGGGPTSAVPSRLPTPGRSVTSAPGGTTVLDLCRVWDAARQDPPGKAVPAPTRRALAAAAGGMPEIDGFCAKQLGKSAEPSGPPSSGTASKPAEPPKPGKPTTTGKPSDTPSPPGKGHGTSKRPGPPEGRGKDRG